MTTITGTWSGIMSDPTAAGAAAILLIFLAALLVVAARTTARERRQEREHADALALANSGRLSEREARARRAQHRAATRGRDEGRARVWAEHVAQGVGE